MENSKKEIRKFISLTQASLSEDFIENESERLSLNFLQSGIYSSSDVVLSYMPMQKEASPLKITLQALRDSKTVALPRVKPFSSEMDFYCISPEEPLQSQVQRGSWKIMEPISSCPDVFTILKKEHQKKLNVAAIVPGVAFSKDGERLGHGKGFYDIYIERLRSAAEEFNFCVTLAGFCLSCQVLPFIPSEEHDVKMDLLFY